jgi:ABC-type multidrug transport system fused ATPase/permease subunit
MANAALHDGTTAAASDARHVAALVGREWRVLLVAIVCAVLGPIAALALPFAAKVVIDDVVGRGRSELLLPIAVAAGLAVMVQALTAYGVTQAGALAGQRAVARLRQCLHRRALRLPVAYFDRTSTGTLVSRVMGDPECVRTLFGSGLLDLVSGALTAALAFAVLLSLDWRLTALVAVALALGAAGLARGFGALQPAFRVVSELQAALAGRLTEVLGGIRVVKSCAAERREGHAFARDNHRLLRASVGAHRHVAALAAAIPLASGGVSLGLLVLGGQAVARGTLTLGDLALFVFLVGLLSNPLIQMAAVGAELGRAWAALARIREVLGLPTEEARDRGKLPVPRVAGAVRCDDVSYAYVPGHPVLRHVSLHAAAGATLAILGANGAGKSTLLSLLAGFDDPTSGRIFIDGRPLTALARSDYRRHVGVVLQRDQLIDGTIGDNVRYARPSASAAEFRQATRLAHCDEFVGQLPAGYETVVGERGVRLSGGQRQRVAIARALLADPRILLLDEATAHLDNESERLVQDAIATLCGGRTTFVIAHRLTTFERADQILVLQSGAVVERGTHDELVGRCGPYWALYQPQGGLGNSRDPALEVLGTRGGEVAEPRNGKDSDKGSITAGGNQHVPL